MQAFFLFPDTAEKQSLRMPCGADCQTHNKHALWRICVWPGEWPLPDSNTNTHTHTERQANTSTRTNRCTSKQAHMHMLRGSRSADAPRSPDASSAISVCRGSSETKEPDVHSKMPDDSEALMLWELRVSRVCLVPSARDPELTWTFPNMPPNNNAF